MRRNPECAKCNIVNAHIQTHCLWGVGNLKARVMLVGEAPGFNEDMKGIPFVGQAGKLLDHVLAKLGYKREQFYITNVFKCRPYKNTLPSGEELKLCWEVCSRYLYGEIEDVNPLVIVPMGNTALHFLTGRNFITRWEGSVLKLGKIYVPAFHPAAVLRNPSLEKNLAAALELAAQRGGMKPDKRMKRKQEGVIHEYPVVK